MGFKLPLLLLSSAILTGCVGTESPPSEPAQVHQLNLPQNWHLAADEADVKNQWLKTFIDLSGKPLADVVQKAS